MAERTLRGSRLGSVSYETDRNTELAPRAEIEYACPKGHTFTVPLSGEAEPPATWECRLDGSISKLVHGAEPEVKAAKAPRTHWDMLMERRTIADLEEVLAERLELLRDRRSTRRSA
ncbi:MAG: RNA polymerase-binding protein RbpA [Mycobacteriales bacterium]